MPIAIAFVPASIFARATPSWPRRRDDEPDDPDPLPEPPPPEEVAILIVLGMGCFTFVVLLGLIILWHSPLVAN